MNLLEIYEENKKRIEEEKQQDNERAFNNEIRQIKSEIILGNEKHYSDNEDLLKKLEIKYKENKFSCFSTYVNYNQVSDSYRKYYFEYNKTNVKKIQDYLDKQLEVF